MNSERSKTCTCGINWTCIDRQVELEKEHICTSVVAVLIQGELLDAPIKMVGREALHIVVSHGNREEKREKEEDDDDIQTEG